MSSTGAPSPDAPAPASARLGVVVVTYHPGDALRQLLDALPAAGCAAGTPVVLADNAAVESAAAGTVGAPGGDGHGDASLTDAAGRPGVTVLPQPGNLGYGRAANAAVAALPPEVELVLLVNPDVVPAPGAVTALLAAADRHPEAGSLGPLIRTEEGLVYPAARQQPSIGTGIGRAALGWCWPGNPWTRAYRLDRAAPTERPAGWLSGACLLLRRTAFEQVGGFDPGYFMYFEDVDLGERLGRAGWVNLYAPSAEVTHTGGHATRRAPAAMVRAHHASAYRYLARRHPRWFEAPLRGALRLALGVRSLLAQRSPQVAGGAALPGQGRPSGGSDR